MSIFVCSYYVRGIGKASKREQIIERQKDFRYVCYQKLIREQVDVIHGNRNGVNIVSLVVSLPTVRGMNINKSRSSIRTS